MHSYFDIANFSKTLKRGSEEISDDNYKNFESIFLNTLNIYAPVKTKMLRSNNSAFMARN